MTKQRQKYNPKSDIRNLTSERERERERFSVCDLRFFACPVVNAERSTTGVLPKLLYFLFIFLIILGGFLFFSGEVMAATIYVDNVGNGYAGSCSTPSDNDYNTDTRDCGSGSSAVYNTVNAGVDALAANDTLIIQPGTYTYSDGVELDYNGVNDNNITIMGADRDTVIFDFNNSGDTLGWLSVSGKTGITIKNLTIKDVGNGPWESGADILVSHVFYILGNSDNVVLENIKFQNLVRKAVFIIGEATMGTVTIRECEFSGIKSTTYGSNYNFISIDGASNPINVTISYNIFRPSAQWWGGGIWLNAAPAVDRTVNIYNNIFMGTQSSAISSGGDNYTGLINNNIFIGSGVSNNVNGQRPVSGSFAGYSTNKVDYNLNYGSTQVPQYYDSQITSGSNELVADIDSGILSYPNYGYLLLAFDDVSGLDTAGWDNYRALIEQNGWKTSFVANVGGWDSRHGGTTPIGDVATEIISFLDSGHDIAVHSHSHTDLKTTSAAMTITYTGGGSKNVTITTNTDNSGFPDWNTIYKDYNNWTGTLTLQDETPVNLINGSGYFKTLEEIAAEITAIGNGWLATATGGAVGQVSKGSFAIALEEGVTAVSTAINFNMEEDPYLWLEIKYAKDRLETIITNVISSSYTVKTYGSPYHHMNTKTMDALMESGYLMARGQNGAVTVGSDWDLRNIARFNIGQPSGFTSGSDATTVENNTWKAAFSSSNGIVYANTAHTGGFDNATEISVWTSIFTKIATLESRGLRVKSFREFADIVSNNTLCPVFSGTVGSDERRHFVNSDIFNGNLEHTSPLIDAGTGVSLTTDYAGNSIYGIPDIGAYEYQPPYTFSANDIPTTGSVRLYSDGQYRMVTASSTSAVADFTVTPQEGDYQSTTTQYMDITIDSWLTSGTYNKQWTATSTSGDFLTQATTTVYTIGDLAANTYYQFKVDGTATSTAITGSACNSNGSCLSDSNGQIVFTYSGGYSTHTFALETDTTSPASFTLSSPVNNYSTSDNKPTLSWNASSDSESDLSHYQLYIDNSLDTNNISGTSVAPANALSCGDHTWYVKAVDNAGNTTDSSAFSISIVCGSTPVWMLNQMNQSADTIEGDSGISTSSDDEIIKDEDVADNDKTITGQIEKLFAYNQPRLKSLAQEQNLAKTLKQLLEEFFGINKIPVHKKHWHIIVNSYIYGNYPIKAITQAIKYGGKTVHPDIPFTAWQKAMDYLDYINK